MVLYDFIIKNVDASVETLRTVPWCSRIGIFISINTKIPFFTRFFYQFISLLLSNINVLLKSNF